MTTNELWQKFTSWGRRGRGEAVGPSWIASPWFWLFVMVMVFGIPLYRSLTVAPPKMLPVIAQLDAFQATNQDGQSFSSQTSLLGAVAIVNFAETPCEDDPCLKRMETMAELQNRMLGVGMSVRLLTFGKDPTRDTPEALKRLGARHTARFRQWVFLSGAAPVGLEPNDDFYLIDQLGRVRTRTPLATREELNLFVRDLAIVINSNSAVE